MLSRFLTAVRRLAHDRAGHIAVTLALAALPLTLATGAGIDYARGLVVRSNMADALDAAGLAVGKQTSKPSACSTASGSTTTQQTACAGMQAIAQQFFNANFKRDSSSTGATPTVVITIANQAVTLSAADAVPTTFLHVADVMLNSTALENMAISASSTVVWGQTKLWVSLVLDNSGSMSQNGKMAALQSASQTLLTTLQNASQTAGDVQVAIVPFTNDVQIGTSYVNSSAISWTNWSAQGSAETPDATAGPGDDCSSAYSYGCRVPGSTSQGSTIPSSGTTKGYICPWSYTQGSKVDGTNGHYFMGCWTSVATGNKQQVSSGSSANCNGYSTSTPTNCTCSGSNGSKTCSTKTWTHTVWVPETDHSLWQGCITDRTQNYDVQDTSPSGVSGFMADNNDYCPDATVTTLGYNWSTLSSQINAMQPSGSTNQAIGVAHGWQMLTPGAPYSTPAIPANTTRYIILLSDGLNTQDRWWGNGSTENSSYDGNIDTHEETTCTNAKADGVVIYSLYVNINSSDGDSAPLQNCASDSSKYFVITQSSDIATAFAAIGQQITNLRVSQ